jgi:hypothetical protein
MDTHSAIETLNTGFFPNSSRTTYITRDQADFELDFVTGRGRGDELVHLDALNVTLQPLRFMEYGMQDTIPWAPLTPSGRWNPRGACRKTARGAPVCLFTNSPCCSPQPRAEST